MRNLWRILFVAPTLMALTFSITPRADSAPSPAPPSVSLVSLIANPEKYDGKYIRVHGIAYLDPKFHLSAIFLTREDKVKANAANGIYLYLEAVSDEVGRLNNHFVVVQGKFKSDAKGHLDAFAGSLTNVDRLEDVVAKIN